MQVRSKAASTASGNPRDHLASSQWHMIVARALVDISPSTAFTRPMRIAHDTLLREPGSHYVAGSASRHMYELSDLSARARNLLWDLLREGATVGLALTTRNEEPTLVPPPDDYFEKQGLMIGAADIFPRATMRRHDLVRYSALGGDLIEMRLQGTRPLTNGAQGRVIRCDVGPYYGIFQAHVRFDQGLGTWIVPESSLELV
jgi:hypothetical protein